MRENIMTNVTSVQFPADAVVVGLCAGRHDMPVKEFIFPQVVDPTDFERMRSIAKDFILSRVGVRASVNGPHDNYVGVDPDYECCGGINDYDIDYMQFWDGEHPLVVYVTGLTACVAAVISVCVRCGVDLTLMHYNRETGEYLPQVVLG